MSEHTSNSGTPASQMDWDALARYLAGESPADEAEAVRRWLAAHPADAEMLGALDQTLNRVRYTPATAEIDVEAALGSVKARRAAEGSVVEGEGRDAAVISLAGHAARKAGTRAPARRSPWRVWIPAAAAAALGVVLWRNTRGPDESAPERTQWLGQTVTTAVGGRDSLRLPDGTRVVLGPSSRLVVGAEYNGRARDVDLEGEAFFEVVHDTTRPFSVRTPSAVVRDIGTAFVVRSVGGRVAVTVTEGIVALRGTKAAADTGVTLLAGDRGTVDSAGRVVAWRNAASDDALAWRRGVLAFREAPMAVVREELRRWYGIELVVPDPALARQFVHGDYTGETKTRAVELIGTALGARVEWMGDTAVLRPAPRR